MPSSPTATSIDEYIATFPPETQVTLEELRQLVKQTAPDATETISYGMPTFDLAGQRLVHFAGYAKHIGLYPVPAAEGKLKEDIAPYQTGKGTAQFRLDTPLPAALIRAIVELRVRETTGKAAR